MNVLHVLHSDRVHGVQLQVYDLVRESSNVGVESSVLLSDLGQFSEMLEKVGIPAQQVEFRNWLNNRTRFQWYRKWTINRWLARKAAKTEFVQAQDLIHTHSITRPFGAMLAEAAGKPHVWHFHERAMPHMDRPFLKSNSWVSRWIDIRTNRVIVPSTSLRQWASGYVDEGKIEIVPNGILGKTKPLPKARPLSRLDHLRISVIGRLGEKKGTFDAIMALGILLGQGVDAELDFAGDVDERAKGEIHQVAQSVRGGDRISFSGYVTDVQQELAACDVVLMPSHYESFGRVTVEAMAAGKPVVATSSGGTLDIVENEVTGVLREPRKPEELADGILWVLDHPEEVEAMRQRAWLTVHENYSREKYAKRIREVYDRLYNPAG